MPVLKCSNGKYRIGTGPCEYHSKEKAESAYAGYRAKEHMKEDMNPIDKVTLDVPLLIRLLELAREELNNDMVIHTISEYLTNASRTGKMLTMDCYDEIEHIVKQDNKPEEPHSEPPQEMGESMIDEMKRLAGITKSSGNRIAKYDSNLLNKRLVLK